MRYDFAHDEKEAIVTNVMQTLSDVYTYSDVHIGQRRRKSVIFEVWLAPIS